jgi:cytosine/adenosine deaminase-related metal-dependent hydrolase
LSSTALLRGARIVPLDGRRQEKRGDVLVESGRLSSIGGLREHVGAGLVVETRSPILPGFVQAFLIPEHHVLGRGFVPDPNPAAFLGDLKRLSARMPAAVYRDAVSASLVRAALSGTTAFLVPVRPDRWRMAAAAAEEARVRVVMALEVGHPELRPALEAMTRGPAGPAISAAIFVGEAEHTRGRHLREAAELSDKAGIPLVALLGARGEPGGLLRLSKAGALTKRTVLVLGTGASLAQPSEVERLVSASAKLVLVPSYSLYTGLALPPLDRLIARGAALALGSFSAAFRLGHDAFREMRLLSRVLREVTESPASTAFEIMSAGGASALALDCGELSVGRRADFLSLDVLVDDEADHETLCRLLLERGGRGAVRSVWVDGRVVAADGRMATEPTAFDEARARAWLAAQRDGGLHGLRRLFREAFGPGRSSVGVSAR